LNNFPGQLEKTKKVLVSGHKPRTGVSRERKKIEFGRIPANKQSQQLEMNARQEIKDYVVLPRGQDNCLPPHSMILDFTMSHDRYRRSNVHPTGKVTSRHLYDDFFDLIFLNSYPETSVLGRE